MLQSESQARREALSARKKSTENRRRTIFAQQAERPQKRRAPGMEMVAGSPLIILLGGEKEPEALFEAVSGIVGKPQVIACVINRSCRIGDRGENSFRHGGCPSGESRPGLKVRSNSSRKFRSEIPPRNCATRQR